MTWTLSGTVTTPTEANAFVATARTLFASNPTASVLMETPPGIYDWSSATSATVGANPCVVSFDECGGVGGTFMWRGTGATIIFPVTLLNFRGRDLVGDWRITDMHMTKSRMKASQGDVVSRDAESLVIQIDEGYPTAGEIFDADDSNSQHLRRYKRSWRVTGELLLRPTVIKPKDPALAESEPRLNFNDVDLVSAAERTWRLAIPKRYRAHLTAYYLPGTFAAIQSKHGEEAWMMNGGVGAGTLTIDKMTLTSGTRNTNRNFTHITIAQNSMRPRASVNGHWPALAASGGGFQVGHLEQPVQSMTISNNRLVSVGDDPIACFNCEGEVRHNLVRDNAGMRGINLDDCGTITGLASNTMVRSFIVEQSGAEAGAVGDDGAEAPFLEEG
jgi:hypothetical protein